VRTDYEARTARAGDVEGIGHPDRPIVQWRTSSLTGVSSAQMAGGPQFELECSAKWRNRYCVVLRYYATGDFDAVRWFVEGAVLRKRLAELVVRDLLDDVMSVEPLPEALRGSTWSRVA
jgi:hypothetical protein